MPTELSLLYHQLPTELQLKIWEKTLEPRCLKIYDSSLREKFSEQYEDGVPPLVLRVCHMLRDYFLPRYPVLFQSNKSPTLLIRPHLRFKPALDRLVVYSSNPQSLISLVRCSEGEDIAKIRHLAISSLLWQIAVISFQYPDWRKAMSKFTSLESLSVVSDEIMPKLDEEGDKFKQAIERTLQLVKSGSENWRIPHVQVIRTGDLVSKSTETTDRLDYVDFVRGDLKESYLSNFIRERGSGPELLNVLSRGLPTIRQISKRMRGSSRIYTPHPSLFSISANTLADQVRERTTFIFDESTLIPACAMAVLVFMSFMTTTSILEAVIKSSS